MDYSRGHRGQWSLPRFNVVDFGLLVAMWIVPCGVAEVIHYVVEDYTTLSGANQASKAAAITGMKIIRVLGRFLFVLLFCTILQAPNRFTHYKLIVLVKATASPFSASTDR